MKDIRITKMILEANWLHFLFLTKREWGQVVKKGTTELDFISTIRLSNGGSN